MKALCGIVGIISSHPVSREGIRFLRALENRGTNSSGIISYNSSTKRFDEPKRGIGSSQEVFNKEYLRSEVDKREGNMLIGHNRYSTAGSDLKRDAQPLLIPRPGMAIAHNGQVLNVVSLKEKFREKEWFFRTECDVEPLMMALAQNLLERRHEKTQDIKSYLDKKLFPSLEDIMKKEGKYHVNGAYSTIVILAGRGLLAFRDSHGFRPLSFGTKKQGDNTTFAFASETSAFNYAGGYDDIREVVNGEAVFVDEKLNVYSKIIHQEEERFCSFEHNYFAGPDSDLEGVKVYDARLRLGRALAEHFKERKNSVDLVMAIPKTAIPSAIEMARSWKKDYGEGMIVRGETRSFLEPTQQERDTAVVDKHIYIKSQIEGKRIAIVDDSYVRGTTSQKIIAKLRAIGAKEVHIFFTYDMISSPCVYGIDTPEKEELGAARHNKNIDSITRELGADSVNFLPHEKYGPAIGVPQDRMCFACVTGEYPTDVSEYQAYLSERKKERAEMVKENSKERKS
jgi:amidophosphoribosyltransferase